MQQDEVVIVALPALLQMVRAGVHQQAALYGRLWEQKAAGLHTPGHAIVRVRVRLRVCVCMRTWARTQMLSLRAALALRSPNKRTDWIRAEGAAGSGGHPEGSSGTDPF